MIAIAAVVCGSAVGLGAYGAHGLKGLLESRYQQPGLVEKKLDQWSTGVEYQMAHGLALLALGLFHTSVGFHKKTLPSGSDRRIQKQIRLTFFLLLAGVLIFSSCLYGLVFGGPKFLGAITPIGGVTMLIGWAMVGVFSFRWTSETQQTAP